MMIDGQFVADVVQRLSQQSVVVQRTNEVFHDVALAFGDVGHVHLFVQLIHTRLRLTIDHFLAVLLIGLAALIYRQVLVVTTNRLQGSIQGRLALLLFVVVGVVFGGVKIF